jgi:hypothetical protein
MHSAVLLLCSLALVAQAAFTSSPAFKQCYYIPPNADGEVSLNLPTPLIFQTLLLLTKHSWTEHWSFTQPGTRGLNTGVSTKLV